MNSASLEQQTQPQTAEKNEAAVDAQTGEEAAKEVVVPVKFNKEIRNLKLEEAAKLAQKGLKFETIAEDYENLKRISAQYGKSVSEFLCALENNLRDKRKKELLKKCGGNEEMAEYILQLEENRKSNIGFDELKREFPDIKDISDLPEQVVENAKMKGTLLLDEYLRYLHTAKANAEKANERALNTANSSVGSQTDRKGGLDVSSLEFLKGIWK